MPAHLPTHTAFIGDRLLATGPLQPVALAAHREARDADAALLVFEDATGAQVELDLRGSQAQVRARYAPPQAPAPEPASDPEENAVPVRGRGRPRLGVVAREVTLLPEHWDWLASQPGGASVALRKLVHEAARAGAERDRLRRAQERSYRAMVALAGNRRNFEEAARALFAGDRDRLRELIASWPRDVRDYLMRLADPAAGAD
jgi:hypothetical protein